jgi:Lon-like protease
MQGNDPLSESTAITMVQPKIKFGFTWLVIIPGSLWVLITYYLPLFGGTLNRVEGWLTTPIIIIFVAASLFCHVAAHLWITKLTNREMPAQITILIFGDASQVWPMAAFEWQTILSACSGPLANLLIAGLTYLLWKSQINDFWGNIVLVVSGFNFWLFVINLIPAFPMDGGRLLSSSLQGFVFTPELMNRLLRYLGLFIAAVLTGWGIFLLIQHSRFSPQTAAIEFLFVLILLDGLRPRASTGKDNPNQSHSNARFKVFRSLGTGLLVLFLSAIASSLLLMNNGLDAPGVALPVESMVNVPAQYRHNHAGHFFLTTVFSHAPILAGEWMIAQVDPAFVVVPPERVVPKNTTPQKQAVENYQMLDDSEATAIAVGLKLAGYQLQTLGKGARVVDVLPESHANGLLQPGDVITSLNDIPIQTPSDLIGQVKVQQTLDAVKLEVLRDQTKMEIMVPLMAPASPSDTPKIGVSVESAGFDFKPPFPISITTQKIGGGPSAGLMFTLTVYNALSPNDLTGGRKIAGTGTINLDGTVGPIGGVKQKVAAAEAVGASYFLCPVENYNDALSVARHIKVIKIGTAQQAIEFLQSLSSP